MNTTHITGHIEPEPSKLDADGIVDLCRYFALRARAEMAAALYNGACQTFAEIKQCRDDFATKADQISNGRWPKVETAGINPADVLVSELPAPAEPVDTSTAAAPAAAQPEQTDAADRAAGAA